MPRPKSFVPTDTDRATVQAMAAAGIEQQVIRTCVGNGKIDQKTFAKHFKRELENTRHEVTATAMGKLLEKIKGGDLGAICFWMKCRAGWNEQAAKMILPVRVQDDFDPKKLSDEDLDAFTKILERASSKTGDDESGTVPEKASRVH